MLASLQVHDSISIQVLKAETKGNGEMIIQLTYIDTTTHSTPM